MRQTCSCPIGTCPDPARAEPAPADAGRERLPPGAQPQPYKVQHPWSRSRRRERARHRNG
ncbi:hypothetical protein [Alcaligenes sp. WGS1538]|uniref:hypothetical protein n=1 Tax=Alcaligenes sp. WGS1538 TaxID=3366811 RepID=UPI00372D8610